MLFSWPAVPKEIARAGNAELPRVWCNPEIKMALIRASEVLDQGPRPADPLFIPLAKTHGQRVTGIVLGGGDGTIGADRRFSPRLVYTTSGRCKF